MKYATIIVAGGKGLRMQSDLPKQFMELAGKPILLHTIEAFLEAFEQEIVVVMNEEYRSHWQKLLEHFGLVGKLETVNGGKTRFHSVKKGLEAISLIEGVVGVHDAVRPFVNTAFLQAIYESAQEKKAVIPAIPLKNSIRQLDENGQSQAVNRATYRLVQTPQCFDIALLKKAYQQPYQSHFTDDASVVEAMGKNIELIAGLESNIKITTPTDWEWAKVLLNKKAQ